MFSAFFIFILGLLAVTRPSESQRRGGPRIVSIPETFEADAGTSITLPCIIRNIGPRSVFWFKGDSRDGRELVMQMKSDKKVFTVPVQYQRIINTGKLDTDGSNLIINKLEASDESTYTCSVAWARQSVSHRLIVNGGAPATPELHLTRSPVSGLVSVGEGLPASLSCIVTGNIPYTIKWYKEDDSRILQEGNVFNIYATSRDDSGRYICTADNSVIEPVSGYIDLTVEYMEVHTDASKVIVSGVDGNARLICRVSGYPKPQVSWYTTTGPVPRDSRHRTFSEGDVHYLEIQHMVPSDFGDYQCYGYSDKARDSATISVVAAPGPVSILDVSPSQSERFRYTVTWELYSLVPIMQYFVVIKEVSSDSSEQYQVLGSPEASDGHTLYRASDEFDFTPGQTYEIMIQAIATDSQPGSHQEEPYMYTVPYGETAPRTDEISRSAASNYDSTQTAKKPSQGTAAEREDAWKWWKVTLTALSRLPALARVMQ